jgi:hypothetical protein
VFSERLEADIRIDPPLAGPADRRTRLERQTRCMREQMSTVGLGPGRSSRSITPSSAATSAASVDELRHGRPAHQIVPRPTGRDDIAVPDDTRSRERRGPALDLPKCFSTGGRY